jgi:hypothetical protein
MTRSRLGGIEQLEQRVFLSAGGPHEGVDEQDGQKGDHGNAPAVYAPHAKVRGATLGQWAAEWWKWAFSMPVDNSALFDPTGAKGYLGDRGKVFFIGGVVSDSGTAERTVTVPAGKPIFFPVLNNECSTLEGNGATEAELLACNDFFIGIAKDIYATVDGVPVEGLAAHRETSGAFGFTLPENNFLQFFGTNAPAGYHEWSVADGYWLMLKPLEPGRHDITFGGTFGDPINFTVGLTYHLNVVPAGKARKQGDRGDDRDRGVRGESTRFNDGRKIGKPRACGCADLLA